jgi:hypothetical protein
MAKAKKRVNIDRVEPGGNVVRYMTGVEEENAHRIIRDVNQREGELVISSVPYKR